MLYRLNARPTKGETAKTASLRSVAVFALALLTSVCGADTQAQTPKGAQTQQGRLVRKVAPLADSSSPAGAAGTAPSAAALVASAEKGPADAPVTIVEFSDLQCPFCRRSVPTLQELLKAYPGKIRLIYKHAPLAFHVKARLAHEAVLAAGAQGKFWEMHDLIFAAQGSIKRDDLLRMAQQVGLDEARFAADLDSRKFSAVVEADKQEGTRLGVGGTPTVFINGKSISGAAPVEEFRKIIDAVIPNSWREPATDAAAARAVVVEDAVDPQLTKGAADAPVTLTWFSDIQSSLTPKAAELVRQVLDAYPGKIRLIFKHRPLELRPEAVEVHEAALAAAKHGKFWEMHGLLVANQKNLKRENLLAFAAQLGLPRDEFARALEAKTYRAAVEKDLHEARRREVRGTPVFFVNGVRIDGLQPLKMFREAVDAELSKTEAGAK